MIKKKKTPSSLLQNSELQEPVKRMKREVPDLFFVVTVVVNVQIIHLAENLSPNM